MFAGWAGRGVWLAVVVAVRSTVRLFSGLASGAVVMTVAFHLCWCVALSSNGAVRGVDVGVEFRPVAPDTSTKRALDVGEWAQRLGKESCWEGQELGSSDRLYDYTEQHVPPARPTSVNRIPHPEQTCVPLIGRKGKSHPIER